MVGHDGPAAGGVVAVDDVVEVVGEEVVVAAVSPVVGGEGELVVVVLRVGVGGLTVGQGVEGVTFRPGVGGAGLVDPVHEVRVVSGIRVVVDDVISIRVVDVTVQAVKCEGGANDVIVDCVILGSKDKGY